MNMSPENKRFRDIQHADKNPVIRWRKPQSTGLVGLGSGRFYSPQHKRIQTFMRSLPGAKFMNRRKVETAMRALPGNQGYQCPRCWRWFKTATERSLHRESHR